MEEDADPERAGLGEVKVVAHSDDMAKLHSSRRSRGLDLHGYHGSVRAFEHQIDFASDMPALLVRPAIAAKAGG